MDRKQLKESLTKVSKATKIERFGKSITTLATAIILATVVAIFAIVFSKGLATFLDNHVNVINFFTQSNWNPGSVDSHGNPQIGALPMIVGSFAVTFLAAIFATPLAIITGIFMTEISPKMGDRILNPIIELLVGIPSVVYGFLGLSVFVPLVREAFGGAGFGILTGAMILFIMIFPTVTSLTVDALKAVPNSYRQASLGMGATRFQMITTVVLRTASPGIMTGVVFGMARAFGEALAVQMVIGNAALLPTSLVSPSSTLTSVLTLGMGNTIDGTLSNNALWTLALILLGMSLLFNIIIGKIGQRGKM